MVGEMEEHVGQVAPENEDIGIKLKKIARYSHGLPFFGTQVFEPKEDKVGNCLSNVGFILRRCFQEFLHTCC